MKTENTCKCNNCDWEGDEEDLTLVEFDANDEEETPTAKECKDGYVTKITEQPTEVDFLKGCPNCLTDGYLIDLTLNKTI